MSALPTVFISYAHEGADRGTLKAFENLLHQASNGELEVLVDDRLEIGDQISKHIARLATCDAAVVLLTPEYLARIEGRKGGVYEEYRLIKHRLDARAETIREEETIQRIVGQKVFDSFVSVVRKCARRFLFSLDGFDTKFDEFRRSTIASFQSDPDQAEERTQFEIDWLRGLFHTIIKLRDEFFEPGIADKIDFCVTVPIH